MKDTEFQDNMKMSMMSDLTGPRQSSLMSNNQPKLKKGRTSIGMTGTRISSKTNILDDTPPEEKDIKDNFLKEVSKETLKDVDFENVVIG